MRTAWGCDWPLGTASGVDEFFLAKVVVGADVFLFVAAAEDLSSFFCCLRVEAFRAILLS